MNGHRSDALEDWSARLADGERIDWDAARAALPPAEFRRLRELAELAETMRRCDPADVKPGERWGHLEVRGELGRGSFGQVMLAFDPILQREVALKLRHADALTVEPEAWINEARQLARVRHPNVLAVHGADVRNGVPGLWADRVEGATLRNRFIADPPPFDELLRISCQLADAVAAVHGHGLVHGDLKPDNVMIESDGRVVLMDFGTSRPQGGNGLGAGSPAVMSPERLAGGPPSRSDDIHALGVVFAFLASGRFPFEADSVSDLRALHSKRIRPRVDGAGTPHGWRALVRAMLDPQPGERPSIGSVVERLERLRTAPARRRRAAVAGTIFVLLVAGLATALTAYVRVRDAESETSAVNELLRDVLAAPRATELGREARVVDVLERAVPEAERRFADRPLALARVRSLVGQSLASLGLPETAEPLLRQAMSTYVQRYGDTHPRALDPLDPIARIESETGRKADAEATWSRLLALADPSDPEMRHEMIYAHIGIAGLRLAENRMDAALARLEDALELHEDEATARAAQSVYALQALVLNRAGRTDEAVDIGERALAESLRVNGRRHVNTLVARDRLIQIRLGRGELEAAELLARDNLADTLDWLGEGERRTIMAQVSLSNVLADLGRAAASLELLDAASAHARDAFASGALDPWVIDSNRAARLMELGRYDDAADLADHVQSELDRFESPVGQLAWINGLNLAEALYRLGQLDASLQRSTVIQRRIVEAHGGDHPLARIADSYRAAALNGLGRPAEAAPLLAGAHARLAALLGADHPQVLLVEGWQVENLWRAGRPDAAREQAAALLERAGAVLEPGHYRLRDLRQVADRVASDPPAPVPETP